MNLGADGAIGHFDDSHEIQLIRPDQKRRVGGVNGLIAFGQAGNGLTEFALLERVQTQARFVEKQDGVPVIVGGLGKKDDEERDQPLETVGALVELDLDTNIVFDNNFQILAVAHDAQTLGLIAFRIGHPGGAQFVGQLHTGGVELIRTAIELVAVSLKRGWVAHEGFVAFGRD